VKKLLGITGFLLAAYIALMISHKNARTLEVHYQLANEIGRYGILSLAAGLLIVTGGIDLSIGSLVCLTSTVFGIMVVYWQVPVGVAFLAMLAVGAVVGTVNGLLVTKVRLQPFMVTLCGLLILRSLARWLMKGGNIPHVESNLQSMADFFNSDTAFFPRYLIVLIVIALAVGVFLHLSVYGRYFLALGSNEKAARFAGIAVDRYKILAYVLCSFLTALYSFLALMYSPSIEPSAIGQYDELYAIAGAVLGGCTLRGGEGTAYGMVVGTMIMRILKKAIIFWDIPDIAEGVMIGLILLAGVAVDELLRRRDVNRQQGGTG
jgi:ribose transport system permease protein